MSRWHGDGGLCDGDSRPGTVVMATNVRLSWKPCHAALPSWHRLAQLGTATPARSTLYGTLMALLWHYYGTCFYV
ncbi:hypothetical protein E2C01_092542 [Portunus trituberculatus]|uniref:Uncharacterized protein n=1 Tax=Portunus trituberculatus TaxID=210409 RepID=A0A5B7JW29_PORTR|nr:hypothetical protein [Portunus trituberculatus]